MVGKSFHTLSWNLLPYNLRQLHVLHDTLLPSSGPLYVPSTILLVTIFSFSPSWPVSSFKIWYISLNLAVWGLNSGPKVEFKLCLQPYLLYVIFLTGSSIFPGLALDCDPPIDASCLAGIIEVNHHAWLACWEGVSLTFSPCWPATAILPSSWVARITGMSHHTQPQYLVYFLKQCISHFSSRIFFTLCMLNIST
jgi:hypothetical protein